MTRSSCISSKLFGGGQSADIAALKSQIATLQAAVNAGTTNTNVDLSAYVTKAAVLANVNTTDYTKLDQLWLRFATQSWVNDQLADVQGAVNNIPYVMDAYAKKTDIPAIPNNLATKDELTLAVADLPKKADKTALESLSTTVSGINTAISENVTAINTELTALKASDTAFNGRITALEARKEIKENKVITVLKDGNTRPDGSQLSGFNHDGTGALAGATSFNSWQAVAETISQTGLPGDVYEISAGFGAAASFGMIKFNINGNRRDYTQAGIQTGTLPMVEFNDGNWRGVTVTVTGDFTGDVTFVGFNGAPAYIPSVIRRTRIDGYLVDGNKISPTTELAALDARIAAIEAIL